MIIRLASALLLATFFFASCKKDDVQKPASQVQHYLTAKTWQVEEITENYGTPKVLYKRGSPTNEDDHSLVRQTFKKDGTVVYVDQFGNSGSDGHYQLLDNDTKIKLSVDSFGGMMAIGHNLQVSANQFSYRLIDEEGYIQYTFTPAP